MYKPVLKINFTDFWEPFDKLDNFFYRLLSKKYTIELSDQPDFLFYSCYGKEYLKYNCVRIFYASENKRPDFLQCDYALSFDYIKRANHYRLPLYQLYIEQHGYYNRLVKNITIAEATAKWKQKTKFCCMLVSNPNAPERIAFFDALAKLRKVDSGGSHLNNIGYNVGDKMEFIKDYKFVIAFENSSYKGYTTEKILEPLVAGCIPVYWGNPLINNDFNSASFLDVDSLGNYEGLIQKMIALDEQEEDSAISMLAEKKVAENAKDHLLVMEEVLEFLSTIIHKKKKIPVAKNLLLQAMVNVRAIIRKIEYKFFKRVNLFVHA